MHVLDCQAAHEVQNYSLQPPAVKKQKAEGRVLKDDKEGQGISRGDVNGDISGYKSKKLGEWGSSTAAIKIQTERTSP